MRGINCLLITLILLSIATQAWAAQNPAAVFREANTAYREGSYTQAASLYESLIRQGWEHAGVFYNLGNAYYKQRKIGQAILQYEKAKRMNPRERDITVNLKFVQSLLEYKMEDKRNWYRRAGEAFLDAFTQAELTLMTLSVGFLFWISWLVPLYFQPQSVWGWRRKTLLGITVFFLFLWISKSSYHAMAPEAVVLKKEAAVRYGPAFKDQVAFRLTEGMKVRRVQKADEWNRVVLINGETGWMHHEDLGEIG